LKREKTDEVREELQELYFEHTLDLAAILGNLLDNVVEAVLRVSEEIKKEITIRYGIGISSINERVKKLKGYSDFSYDTGYFNSIVVLPIT
jgi:two-component system sensor histidine kinase AgrC